MKKVTLFLVLIFALSACSGKSIGQLDENTAPSEMNGYNDQDVVSKLNEIKTQGVEEVKKNSTKPPVKNNTNNKVQLSDLIKDFNGIVMHTNKGDIEISLYSKLSPLTVNNFLNLANDGFYDGTKFHRVIPNFMIQGGDPNSKDNNWDDDGMGGPGYKFPDEFNSQKLVKGSLAMANSGPNTNGSQFFIVTAKETPWLDGKHTNFGQVIEGLEVVDMIEGVKTNEKNHPLEDVIIESINLVKF